MQALINMLDKTENNTRVLEALSLLCVCNGIANRRNQVNPYIISIICSRSIEFRISSAHNWCRRHASCFCQSA